MHNGKPIVSQRMCSTGAPARRANVIYYLVHYTMRYHDSGCERTDWGKLFLHRHAQISTWFRGDYACAVFLLLVVSPQIDREENFTSQFKDGGEGKTEPVKW